MGRLDGEADADRTVTRSLRVASEEREARRRRVAGHEQLDDRLVDRPALRRAQGRRRELAHLFVLEAVVGRGSLLLFGQQAGRHRRLQGLGELRRIGRGAVHAERDLAQVLQAESTAEDRRERQELLRRLRELRRPA